MCQDQRLAGRSPEDVEHQGARFESFGIFGESFEHVFALQVWIQYQWQHISESNSPVQKVDAMGCVYRHHADDIALGVALGKRVVGFD